MNASTVFLPILLKIVRQGMVVVGAWLVEKHIATADQSTTVQTYVVDAIPGLLVLLPGLFLEMHMWLKKFKFIANMEAALHLPVTGLPDAATVAHAAATNTIAQSVVSPSAQTEAAAQKVVDSLNKPTA